MAKWYGKKLAIAIITAIIVFLLTQGLIGMGIAALVAVLTFILVRLMEK